MSDTRASHPANLPLAAHWGEAPVPAMRHEALYGDRIVRCFAERPRGVFAMFAATVARAPQAEALVAGERRWTSAQLDADVATLAAGFAAQGVQRGERVVMFIDNRPEFVTVWLALQRLGAITVPVGVREQRPGLAYIARQCGAAAIVADADLVEQASGGPLAVEPFLGHLRERYLGEAA